MITEAYEATLINFGYSVYTGESLEEAKAAVLKAGFEASIRFDGALVAFYSPISGWKNY